MNAPRAIESYPVQSYTNKYAKGDGSSRCVTCVHGHYLNAPSDSQSASGRYNISSSATVSRYDLDNPFAEGAFRYVAQGTYTPGPRCGQPCVKGWFKTGLGFEKDYFTLDIKAVDKALEIVNQFNDLNIVDKPIKINIPAVLIFGEDSDEDLIGAKILIEPFIRNYEKFNSNWGWYASSERRGEVMQAVSHFSYHVTGGFCVLCDLQGGIYRHEAILSDPFILSRRREYGVTDHGPEGISSFFHEHVCTEYCRPH